LRQNRRFIYFVIFIFFIIIVTNLPLNYYVYSPGSIESLAPVVQVESGYENEGDLHLVTVRGGQATPLSLIPAIFSDYRDIHHMDDLFPEGYDRTSYMEAQLELMENSQEAAIVVAYQKAGEQIEIKYEGVYVVSVLEDMPAEEHLETADKIIEVEGLPIIDAKHLVDTVDQYQVGDELTFLVERDEERFEVEIELVPFIHDPDNFGIGIQLVTNREVEIERQVTFASGDIGGPSAGLIMALEIYNQLVEEDITKGLKIAGTGEIDYDGYVSRIGGVDKKVVAADRENCDIFFVPNEQGAPDSNYEVAKATAEDIGTDMEIVPVDHFEDALDYLQQ